MDEQKNYKTFFAVAERKLATRPRPGSTPSSVKDKQKWLIGHPQLQSSLVLYVP